VRNENAQQPGGDPPAREPFDHADVGKWSSSKSISNTQCSRFSIPQ
jgi:hypothetical protein